MISKKRIRKKKKWSWVEYFRRLGRVLNATPKIGGLEISDTAVRFVERRGRAIKTASLKLPPGIITDGRLTDRGLFIEALRGLRAQIGPKNKNRHVVIALPPHSVYVEAFSIPVVARSKIRESAELNLQMISPIDVGEARYDYQLLSPAPTPRGELELLGAFVSETETRRFTEALEEALFTPVAIEFPALSLTRLVREQKLLGESGSYLVADLTNDGLMMVIIRDNNAVFHHFTYWRSVEEGGGLEAFVKKEITRVISFYNTRYQKKINEVVIVSYATDQVFSQTIHGAFPDISVRSLILGEFSDLSPVWFVAMGAALRGNLPRFNDHEITLTPVGAEEGYFRSAAINLIHFWRNVILIVLVILLGALFIGDAFLARFNSRLSQVVALQVNLESIAETERLIQKADEFNNLLELALLADQDRGRWSAVLRRVQVSARRNRVGLDLVSITADQQVRIAGRADTEKAVLDFKNAIDADPEFAGVSLPLTSITVKTDGTFEFIMSFGVVKPGE